MRGFVLEDFESEPRLRDDLPEPALADLPGKHTQGKLDIAVAVS
jgi:hypothetical protein